ncbi:MAG: CehA/McbA family metallohydrolase [Bacteroidales bacterium]|nr:CehA/McbA family metallohydrolase [Bacteroidales bacterium]
MTKDNLINVCIKFLLTATFILLCLSASGQENTLNIRIDGAVRYQTLDGFGVNINPAWWYGGDYGDATTIFPAIDLLIDSLGATIFRVVIEEIDWEAENDDNDPSHFNWDYFNTVFSSKKFRCIWDALRYLNKKGISKDLVISFMGAPPSPAPLAEKDTSKSWMGGTDYNISPDKEEELAESIAALLFYMRNTAKIDFCLVSPMNETDVLSWSKRAEHPDGIVEGPNIPDPVQYVRIVRKLAKKLDSIGMSDIRFVTPDAAGDKLFTGVLNEMIKDTLLMGKLACWGVHQYGNDASDYREIINRPTNLTRAFWITETAGIANMLGQLDDDARAFIFWDGFDCVYQHGRRNGYGDVPPNDWAFWMTPDDGKPLIEYVQATGVWKPRKQFYQHAQLMKFIKPGAVRLNLTGQDTLIQAHAFGNTDGSLVITGQNRNSYVITIKGTLKNLLTPLNMRMIITDTQNNLTENKAFSISGRSFSAEIPPDCIFTIIADAGFNPAVSERPRPEPAGWYAGDIHVHRNCGEVTTILPENEIISMMEQNDLAVVTLLADMGNGEVKDSRTDLPKVNGEDAIQSRPGRIIHWDAEWHFDPAGVTFENKALGGHIILLGLKEARTIWNESTYRILDWGRSQNAVTGFCHMQYLNDGIPTELTCCTPIDYPVEVALGTVDFLSEDVWLNDAALNGYYKILNCGFRPGWTAGTDFPCNNSQPPGSLLTYVKIKDKPLTYSNWIEGIKAGRTVVSTNGHNEFLDLRINGNAVPGDEIKIKLKRKVKIDATWSSISDQRGKVEIVCNGKVVGSIDGNSGPDTPLHFRTSLPIGKSSWICARRMDENGHRTHTSPVYISFRDRPVRASADDARFFVDWIDNILEKIEPGGPWNQFFTSNPDFARERYLKAREIYKMIAAEASVIME